MRLRLSETHVLSVEILEEETFTSPHTKKDLTRFQVSFDVRRDRKPELEEAFSIAKRDGVQSLNDDGTVGRRWLAKLHRSTYNDASLYEEIEWELAEMESLSVSRLKIGELELQPSYYAESAHSDSIQIATIATLSDEQQELFLKMRSADSPYFNVLREGISDELLEMRFGRLYWSQDGEEVRQGINLVERSHDDLDEEQSDGPGFAALYSLDVFGLQEDLAVAVERLCNLIALLQEKGFVTDADKEQVEVVSSEAYWKRRNIMERVNDVTEWVR